MKKRYLKKKDGDRGRKVTSYRETFYIFSHVTDSSPGCVDRKVHCGGWTIAYFRFFGSDIHVPFGINFNNSAKHMSFIPWSPPCSQNLNFSSTFKKSPRLCMVNIILHQHVCKWSGLCAFMHGSVHVQLPSHHCWVEYWDLMEVNLK